MISSGNLPKTLLVEESDFSTWREEESTLDPLYTDATHGIAAILTLYAARKIDIHLGAHLDSLTQRVGFQITGTTQRARLVVGGSPEARFHKVSFEQLITSLSSQQTDVADTIARFGAWFGDARLCYTTRMTVAVRALRSVCKWGRCFEEMTLVFAHILTWVYPTEGGQPCQGQWAISMPLGVSVPLSAVSSPCAR